MPIKAVISGATGRMGQTLVRLIADAPQFVLVGGIDKDARHGAEAEKYGFAAIETAATAGPLIQSADALLDFSAIAGLQSLLADRAAELAGKAVVIGTTGLTSEIERLISQLARTCPVVVAANFSVAVNLMLNLTETAARILGADRYDLEIVEAHHKRKVDAPSGTALALARAAASARGVALDDVRRDGRTGETGARPAGEIGIHAVRGGEIVGEHRVQFIGLRDRLEIAHSAQDRGLFAEGALLAAAWAHGKPPRRYSMPDVLGMNSGTV